MFKDPSSAVALLCKGGYGCVSGQSIPLPFADQNFSKSLDSMQTNGENFLKYVP